MYSLKDIHAFAEAIYDNKWFVLITPYVYPVTFTGLAQGASATTNLPVQANADFVLTHYSYRANIGAAQSQTNQTAPFVRVLITDTGSSEQFFNSPVDLDALCANGQRTNGLLWPRVVRGRTSLSIQATSYAPTAETYSFDLNLHGFQVRGLAEKPHHQAHAAQPAARHPVAHATPANAG